MLKRAIIFTRWSLIFLENFNLFIKVMFDHLLNYKPKKEKYINKIHHVMAKIFYLKSTHRTLLVCNKFFNSKPISLYLAFLVIGFAMLVGGRLAGAPSWSMLLDRVLHCDFARL